MSTTFCAAGASSGGSASGVFISGLMRFQETSARCTALKSFAALADLVESFRKQERNVVNAAISHVLQPVPSTFFAPNHRMKSTLTLDRTR